MNPRVRGPLRLGILALLQLGPLPAKHIIIEIRKTVKTPHLREIRSDGIQVTLSTMVRAGELTIIGTARQAEGRFPGVVAFAGVYALHGTEKLPPMPGLRVRRGAARHGAAYGSGVVAPPPYRTGFRWGGLGT